MLQKKLRSIAMATVQDYVPHALVVVKENVRDAREVVKMVVRPPVEVVVAKDVKDVVMQCVKAIASLDVRLPATVYVGDRA